MNGTSQVIRIVAEEDHKNQHSENRTVTNATRMYVELLSDNKMCHSLGRAFP